MFVVILDKLHVGIHPREKGRMVRILVMRPVEIKRYHLMVSRVRGSREIGISEWCLDDTLKKPTLLCCLNPHDHLVKPVLHGGFDGNKPLDTMDGLDDILAVGSTRDIVHPGIDHSR